MGLLEKLWLKIFTPIWSYVNENEKKVNIQKLKILKNGKKMVWRYGRELHFHEMWHSVHGF